MPMRTLETVLVQFILACLTLGLPTTAPAAIDHTADRARMADRPRDAGVIQRAVIVQLSRGIDIRRCRQGQGNTGHAQV